MRFLSPVFLIVSGRLDDTNALLDEIKQWLVEFLGPLIYEIRDTTNTMAGMTPEGTYPYMDSLLRIESYMLFLVVVCGCWLVYKFLRLFF